jgi:hypothetical protein
MADLDKRLERLLESEDIGLQNEGIQSYDYPKMVSKIKQAFQEAGWVKLKVPNHAEGDVVELHAEGLMTGQEWYDRFEKEYLKAIGYPNVIGKVDHSARIAARRAAGLEPPQG